MAKQEQPIVTGKAGLRGRIVGHEGEEGGGSRVVLELDTGERVLIDPGLLSSREDGGYDLPFGPEELPTLNPESSATVEQVVPLAQEELRVGKETHENKVRIKIAVHEREETVDLPLLQERVNIERVPINRLVEQPPVVRMEGEVIVVPLLEEVLSVEKKLMLREEVRITRQSTETHRPQQVKLRHEEARVERVEDPDRPSPAGSDMAA